MQKKNEWQLITQVVSLDPNSGQKCIEFETESKKLEYQSQLLASGWELDETDEFENSMTSRITLWRKIT